MSAAPIDGATPPSPNEQLGPADECFIMQTSPLTGQLERATKKHMPVWKWINGQMSHQVCGTCGKEMR